MNDVYAVILCGGRGERFWPRSRQHLPKQFVRLFTRHSLTKATSDRIKRLCPLKRQLFVAPERFRGLLKSEIPVAEENLILEPVGKNTAPAIGLSAVTIRQRSPEGIMVVLPADHLISPTGAFLKTVRLGVKLAREGWLVTFGIKPTRPDTNYGYIRLGEELIHQDELTAYRVKEFKEKPSLRTARRYLDSRQYLWNSGMFVWRVDVILKEFACFMPDFYKDLILYSQIKGARWRRLEIERIYQKVEAISIDYAIMEKAADVAVVEGVFEWDDVGSWLALARRLPVDRNGNVCQGIWFGRDTSNSIIYSDDGVVATLGISNLIIVRSGDAVLVADKGAIGELRQLLRDMEVDPQGRRFL